MFEHMAFERPVPMGLKSKCNNLEQAKKAIEYATVVQRAKKKTTPPDEPAMDLEHTESFMMQAVRE